jgi:hypothetical protein
MEELLAIEEIIPGPTNFFAASKAFIVQATKYLLTDVLKS